MVGAVCGCLISPDLVVVVVLTSEGNFVGHEPEDPVVLSIFLQTNRNSLVNMSGSSSKNLYADTDPGDALCVNPASLS